MANEKWLAWVDQAKAGPIPRAVEFLKFVQVRGVALVYITNRTCKANDENDPTVRNLRRLGAPWVPSRPLCREGSSSDKAARRAAAAAAYRVLLLIGDRWFLIPNPKYGSKQRLIQR